jgi:hypothetical protein
VWARLQNLRTQSVQDPSYPAPHKPMVTCGAAMVTPRRSTKFIRVNGLDSCRKWQKTFFYVKNDGSEDFINLPPMSKERQKSSTGRIIRVTLMPKPTRYTLSSAR